MNMKNSSENHLGMAKKVASKGYRNVRSGVIESQNLDPLFGQSRAFALEGNLVNPQVRKYLDQVRRQALCTLGADPTYTTHKIEKRNHDTSLYDDEPLLDQSLAYFNKNCQSWLKWFRELEGQAHEGSFSLPDYTPETLDLLMFYFKNFLQAQHILKENEDEGGLQLLNILNILEPLHIDTQDETLEMDDEWACSLAEQLKSKRGKTVRSLDDLRRFISKPAPLPSNFNSWHYYITTTEPTNALLRTLSPEQVFRLASYLNQWLGDISKGKHVEKLSQWTLFILVYLDGKLPSPEVSVLRDLGKKARSLKLKKTGLQSNDDTKFLHVPRDMDGPQTLIEPLTALDLVMVVVAFKYGQRDLIEWSNETEAQLS
ncbi:LADA_0D01662g1_1 [Lachancea dasiensis]|uniref:LADA_0D01662g1_1 n=1 Tax=Lachancea dasiensis TaxID=1072105 RepID=A0A1G4J411_9SACH|nr:LADA_0D01662g1_1 [Lachancea dasiensis]